MQCSQNDWRKIGLPQHNVKTVKMNSKQHKGSGCRHGSDYPNLIAPIRMLETTTSTNVEQERRPSVQSTSILESHLAYAKKLVATMKVHKKRQMMYVMLSLPYLDYESYMILGVHFFLTHSDFHFQSLLP